MYGLSGLPGRWAATRSVPSTERLAWRIWLTFKTLEAGTLYGLSRALREEVTFDTEKVTNVNWRSYPTLTHADSPERIDVVLVNGDPNPVAAVKEQTLAGPSAQPRPLPPELRARAAAAGLARPD